MVMWLLGRSPAPDPREAWNALGGEIQDALKSYMSSLVEGSRLHILDLRDDNAINALKVMQAVRAIMFLGGSFLPSTTAK